MRGDQVAAELNRLKRQDGNNIGTVGSATLVRSPCLVYGRGGSGAPAQPDED